MSLGAADDDEQKQPLLSQSKPQSKSQKPNKSSNNGSNSNNDIID